MEHKQIAILDFGSQYTHLISRRIRQLDVLAKIYAPDTDFSKVKNIGGIILSGGPRSIVKDKGFLRFDPGIFKMGVPVLGLCYGHQLIATYLGGTLLSGDQGEYGQADLFVEEKDDIFKGLKDKERIWMSHGDQVVKMPEGFELIGATTDCPVAAMRNKAKKVYGFQFHPEVNHTKHGQDILSNFVFDICKMKPDWKVDDMTIELMNTLKTEAKNKNVFLLVSGGVDSTVSFALLEKALGLDDVYGLHVDNGFMRKDESKKVMEFLKKAGFPDLHMVDASARFLKAVEGVIDPEKKRQIIGEMFVNIANEEMEKLDIDPDKEGWLLGQGTIYPDTIESGSTQHADKIKTHHNRVDLIQEMMDEGKIIEPIADFYKDEVRELGKQLKINRELLSRHPFPGPGLAIRCLCSDGKEKVEEKKRILDKLGKYVKPHGLDVEILPVKSVGVQGDERTYRHPAVIIGETDWELLNTLSINITNDKDINRVIYLVDKKKISSEAKMKKATLTKKRLDLLREVDDEVTRFMREKEIYKDIWQNPVVLVPFGNKGESIVLRPIESEEAMTVNFYRMDDHLLKLLVNRLKKIKGIDYIFYDITNKPPGTIEWE
ncbi:glutamine-hydrolyzing GMP synthase [Patescibacteria group bacterium]|nr:glutamine-hydrolyzing GMP synthase [Patescibacteria group bacterium]MBU1674020.1 glutamine-hydrolyzing GMP synthase [Patescibacteria group bacterium]MBU1963174.1 glutamine-hydrolyzing GMP synthase [Patescibacteria group bacterium]